MAALPGVALKVFLCSRKGAETHYDRDFGTQVKWDIPLVDGYEWEFHANRKPIDHWVWEATEAAIPDIVVCELLLLWEYLMNTL